MSEKKKAGRPAGTNAEVLAARKMLTGHLALKQKFEIEYILEAMDVILAQMRDPSANHATKRACAGDIMKLYFDLHKDSLEVVAEFEEGKAEKKRAKAEGKTPAEESKQTGTEGRVMRFSLASSKDKD